MPEEKKVPIKPYTKSELMHLYGVSMYVIRKWLKKCIAEFPVDFPANENDHSHLLSIRQIEIFFGLHGHPELKVI
jgi:hypothetical protein